MFSTAAVGAATTTGRASVRSVSGRTSACPMLSTMAVPTTSTGRLTISGDFQASPTDCFCVNALIHTSDKQAAAGEALAKLGQSVVVLPAESGFKVHIHTADRQRLRAQLGLPELSPLHRLDRAIEVLGPG